MKQLIATYKEAMKAPQKAALELRIAFEALPLPEKMGVIVREKLEKGRHEALIFDTLLHSDSCYTGPCTAGCDVSLYDDLHWDRFETKTLSEVLDMAIDKCEEEDETTGDETAEQLVAILLASESPRCEVLRDFLSSNLGSAENDW